jgi:hypothetical protein
MPKQIKTCFFQIDGPIRQQHIAAGYSYWQGLHTLLEYANYAIKVSPHEVVELPRVRFQAQMTFVCMANKRILMKDRFGRDWSVYGSYIDLLVPRMTKGVIECWWEMTKKSNVYGLTADVEAPLGKVAQDRDIPLMLEKSTDLNSLRPYFEAMAV